jgi:hypothetical protein
MYVAAKNCLALTAQIPLCKFCEKFLDRSVRQRQSTFEEDGAIVCSTQTGARTRRCPGGGGQNEFGRARTRAPSQICSEISKVWLIHYRPKPLDQHQCRPDLDDLRLGRTSNGGKNETVTSRVVLVRTHFYPVRMAGLVRWASDGNGKSSAGSDVTAPLSGDVFICGRVGDVCRQYPTRE